MRFNNWLQLLSVACTCLGLVRAASADFPLQVQQPNQQLNQQQNIQVLDRGAEPRQELRYRFKKDTTENVVFEMQMAQKMNMGGQPVAPVEVPPIEMSLQFKTLDVLANGDARVSLELVGVNIKAKPGADPNMTAAMRQAMQKLVGMKGQMTVTTRGESKDVQIQPPPGAGADVVQQINGMQQQLSEISAPLPQVSVGLGAKWQSTTTYNANNLTMTQSCIYTVRDAGKDSATLDMAITQNAKPQALQGIRLQKMQSTGSGTDKIDFTRLVPVDLGMKMETKMVMAPVGQAAGANGGNGNIEMEMSMNLTMKPKEEPAHPQ
jgi:hypothetical protein